MRVTVIGRSNVSSQIPVTRKPTNRGEAGLVANALCLGTGQAYDALA
jgi:hypothetical protein